MKTFTSKSTKQEILEGYGELAQELKELKERSAAGKPGRAPAPEAAPSAPSAPAAAQESTAVNFDDLTRDLDSIRTRFGDASSTLQQHLLRESGRLEGLRADITGYTEHLKALHAIEVGDDTTRELVRRYLDTQRSADEAFAARKRKVEEELEARKTGWRKQQDERTRSVAEADAAGKLARTREAEEYGYATTRGRTADADALTQEKKRLQAELDGLQEVKTNQWNEREQAIAIREQEYAELKAKAVAYPKELEAATNKAEAEGMAIARRQSKIASDLAQKDFEGRKKVQELKIGELEAASKKQDEQILELSKQLATALKQAQDLAIKAIDGASNSTSFAAVKEIALEQAKTSQKFK
ncbi:hypothetical protein [Nannocystis bainbridge]|uniref:Uncharacterized protein n=1 Tax=Nannocystis bainbridge TaxID=2995303 RepID=A0ABT5DWD2_9BACT|nr:hypothetical protein [Nannocystis bainbridge]MDC0717463.1 hypothetical protein [Nannocystis bainbridge]